MRRIILGMLFVTLWGTNVHARDLEIPRIPVLEYHNLSVEESRWSRSFENFQKDLEYLYNNDYYLITFDDFIAGRVDAAPAGKKPVLMTFDDAVQPQFSYLADGSIDPRSAVGMMGAFCGKHPDFNCTAIFYVNANAFRQPELVGKKFRYLIDQGYELGNHTWSHVNFNQAQNISYQVGKLNSYIQSHFDEPIPIAGMAYPFGIYPKDEARFATLKKGEYEGEPYEIRGGFLVGAHPSVLPSHPDFDPYAVPRIQAIDDEWKRWFGRHNSETGKTEELFNPYVSTGEDYEEPQIAVEVEDVDFSFLSLFQSWGENMLLATANIFATHEISEEPEVVVFEQDDRDLQAAVPTSPIPDLPFDFYAQPPSLDFRDGIFYYQVQDGETWKSITDQFFHLGFAHTKALFVSNLKSANPKGLHGEIVIPDIALIHVTSTPDVTQPRGIYMTGYSVVGSGKKYVDALVESGGNLITFDTKAGRISYDSQVPLARELNDISKHQYDLKKWVEYLHQNDIYAVARVVMFKDEHLASKKPEWRLKSVHGGHWQNWEGPIWLDPSNAEVRAYYLDLIEEMAQLGVDEVQLDYVRFPALGPVASITYADADKEKHEVITDFVRHVKERLQPYGTKLSADVFGVIGWSPLDADIVGQRVPELAEHLDVMYPMIYPSHFGEKYDGQEDPANKPHYFIYESMKRFNKLAEGSDMEMRPWFQGFPLGVTNFGKHYMREQKRALNDLGLDAFVVWSPGNIYWASWDIMKAASLDSDL